MSPEQARGEALDQRTDIWSFGCLPVQMLTGRAPFAADTISDTLVAILEREPAQTLLPADTPSGIRRLLRRCLQRIADGACRPRETPLLEIDDARTGAEETPTVTASRHRERLVWIVTTLVLLAVAVTLGMSYLRAPADVADMRVDITTPVHGRADVVRDFSRWTAGWSLLRTTEGRARLWMRPLDAATAQPLAGTEGAIYPFWSPDSRALGFFADGKLNGSISAGGLPQTLASAPAVGVGPGIQTA